MDLNFIPFIVWCLFVALALYFSIRSRRKPPSEFAAGIALSLRNDPNSWDYKGDEDWLYSHKTPIALSVRDFDFGRVASTDGSNTGSRKIETFTGSSKRAVRDAYKQWCESTAIERRMKNERRKQRALAELSAI